MKTLNQNQNQNQKWSAGLRTIIQKEETDPRPQIGDDDGISDKAMNMVIVLFMLLTVGVTVAAAETPGSTDANNAGLFRKAMDDMDQMRFDHAINKLLKVKKLAPDNANLDYLLGKCYLYGDVSPEKAAFYLNRAASCISFSYESWDVSETCAPVETIYLLARAYERTEHYDLAVEYYGQFLVLIEDGPVKSTSRTYAIVSGAAQKCKQAAQNQHSVAFNNK